jgi:tetratricopeptide (TPR) repeat protein
MPSPTRFQAVGLLGGAAGAVVLPEMSADIALQVDEGRFDTLPAPWRFLADLARGAVPRDDPGEINRLLLSGDGEGLAERSRRAGEQGDGDLASLLAAAAYRLGADLPRPDPERAGDARVRAYLVATEGHEAAAEGDATGATERLLQAAAEVASVSPAASARLVGEAASIAQPRAGPRLILELDRAAERLKGLAHEELRGDLLMTRGGLLMETGSERPAVLQEAVQSFQKATQALPRRTHPVAYAVCHLNVAVAYLAMPMGSQAARLRAAIAVQSLREALEILDPDAHPDLWEAATLNLANALQHLPSSHIKDNLAEAVSHYEALLERRTGRDEARARTLANLGNALAHLGDLTRARTHLAEARTFFRSVGNADAAAGIDGVLAEIDGAARAPSGGSGPPPSNDPSDVTA